jgi:hypothetical protein
VTTESRSTYLACAVFAGVLLLAACDASVKDGDEGKSKDVDVRSPVGNLSVRTSEDPPETGLAMYPGARFQRDEDEDAESADVNISTPFFGLRVVAAEFESDDPPQAIVDFYSKEMKAYGDVMKCNGNVEFEGEDGVKKPVCNEKVSREIQLVTGIEEKHRLVAVKPRGSGSEFAVVYIDMGERN